MTSGMSALSVSRTGLPFSQLSATASISWFASMGSAMALSTAARSVAEASPHASLAAWAASSASSTSSGVESATSVIGPAVAGLRSTRVLAVSRCEPLAADEVLARTSSAGSGSRRSTAQYTRQPLARHRPAVLPGRRSSTPADIELALDAAHAAKDAWGATPRRPSARRSSTRSPTRSTRTSRCSRSPRAGRTASRSARRSPPTSRSPSTTSATSRA